MDKLAIHLSLHGAVVLTISVFGGLFLYQAIFKKKNEAGWHLLHAGGTARGIMLIALAAIIDLPVLPAWLLSIIVWLTIFFVWTSVFAMIIVAVTGERGFGWFGSNANKLAYSLYALGTIAIFPALLLLAYGLFNAL